MPKNQLKARVDGAKLDDLVYEYFLRHNMPCTPAELAAKGVLSLSTIQKRIRDNDYKASDTTKDIPVREKNYNTVKCTRTVPALQPSLTQLRAKLLRYERPDDQLVITQTRINTFCTCIKEAGCTDMYRHDKLTLQYTESAGVWQAFCVNHDRWTHIRDLHNRKDVRELLRGFGYDCECTYAG